MFNIFPVNTVPCKTIGTVFHFVAFSCHSEGSPAILYAPQHQLLISGGKKGDVSIFDVRQRQLRHSFLAHDSAIKSMSLDPMEDFFVTGSADGDIKVGNNMLRLTL